MSEENQITNEENIEPVDFRVQDPLAAIGFKAQPGEIYYIDPPRDLKTYPCYIDNPQKISKGIKPFIQYTMSGSDVTGDLPRRYSDFFKLYEKLTARWPGVYVPRIPQKVMIGNMESRTIKKRMRLLNRFLLNLSTIDYLYNSEEAQVFRGNVREVGVALEKLPKFEYAQIQNRMQSAFPRNDENYDLILGKSKITEFDNAYLKKTLKHIEGFKKSVAGAIQKREIERRQTITLIKNFKEYERVNLMTYVDNDDSKLVFFNPTLTELSVKVNTLELNLSNAFLVLEEFLDEEFLDIEAMCLAIKQINDYFTIKENLKKKIDGLELDIRKMEAGGINPIVGLFKKKEDLVSKAKNDKLVAESQLASVDAILRMVCDNMESQIEAFKAEHTKNYYRNLKIFAILQRENNRVVREMWVEAKKALSALFPDYDKMDYKIEEKLFSPNTNTNGDTNTISKEEFLQEENQISSENTYGGESQEVQPQQDSNQYGGEELGD